MASYPETIVLERASPEYDHLARHSGLIQNLFEDERGNIELSADLMFPNESEAEQKRLWELFVDIFFPEIGVHRLFVIQNNALTVDPRRGTLDDVRGMLDYMMVDEPETMMDFAMNQARKRINAPARVAPNERAPRDPGAGAEEFTARQAALAARNAPPNVPWANNNGENYENESSVNNIRLGQREENNEYIEKLSNQNIRRFGLNQRRGGRRRSNRRTRRNKKGRKGKATRRNHHMASRRNRKESQ